MTNDMRNIAAVVLALSLLQVASGALAVSIPLALDLNGFGPFAVGVTTAFFGVGLLIGALAAPDLIVRIGHIRAFAFFAAIAAALSLLMFARIDPFTWSVVRLGIGACMTGIFTAGESWIAAEANPLRRGALLGVYQVLAKVALVAGAFVVGGFAADGPVPYMVAGGLFAICLAPVAATRNTPPAAPSAAPMSLRQLFAMAPAAVYGVGFAGFVNGGVVGLSPIYAAASAPVDDPVAQARAAAAFYAAMTIGGIASQLPAGWISDGVDRRLVVAALAATAAAASFALALTPPLAPEWLRLFLAFIWGAGSFSFYGVAVAHAIDRAPSELHAKVIGGLLMVWAGGNIAGPPVAGLVMQIGLGGAGLFVYAGLALAVLVFLQTRRLTARERAPETEREKFAPVIASSIVSGELDPRSEDDWGRQAGQGAATTTSSATPPPSDPSSAAVAPPETPETPKTDDPT